MCQTQLFLQASQYTFVYYLFVTPIDILQGPSTLMLKILRPRFFFGSQVRGGDEENWYETDLETLFTEDDEVKEFFVRLDEQLNKVNQFYRTKEAEFLERGEILNKQLHILLDLKRVLHERHRKLYSSKSGYGTSPPGSMSPSLRGSEFTGNPLTSCSCRCSCRCCFSLGSISLCFKVDVSKGSLFNTLYLHGKDSWWLLHIRLYLES